MNTAADHLATLTSDELRDLYLALPHRCDIDAAHCEQCGSTDHVNFGTGYTGCCNELVTSRHGCRGHHVRNDRFNVSLEANVRKAGYASTIAMVDADRDAFTALELEVMRAWGMR